MIVNQLIFYRLYFSLIGRIAPRSVMQKAFTLFHTPHPYKRSDIEDEWLEKAEHFTFTFEMYDIAGYRWGKEGNPKVLIVHGWTGVATSMYQLVDAFVEEGYQVISYDAIGHGQSSGELSTLSQWADCLRAMNDFVGEVECIVAHSLGGVTTFVVSKLGLKTKKIVLIAPFCNPIEIIDKWFGERLNIPSNVLKKLPEYFWDKQKVGLLKYGEDWSDIFDSTYKVPTLIIHDKEDKEVSEKNVASCCTRWPWAKFVETEGLGHRRILYDKSIAKKMVSFVHHHDK